MVISFRELEEDTLVITPETAGLIWTGNTLASKVKVLTIPILVFRARVRLVPEVRRPALA